MSGDDIAMVAFVWAGYLLLAAVCLWGALRLTRDAPGTWKRKALVSLLIAVFFAPSVVGGGHGGGLGPAWMALFQMHPIKLGTVPILVTFAICYAVWTVVARVGGATK